MTQYFRERFENRDLQKGRSENKIVYKLKETALKISDKKHLGKQQIT